MIAECGRCGWRGVPTLTDGRPVPGTARRYMQFAAPAFRVEGSTPDMRCPRAMCRAPIAIVAQDGVGSAPHTQPELRRMTVEEQEHGGEELREEDVTREDGLDDRVREGEGLPPATAGGTAEGEDSSTGQTPASSDPSVGQDPPDDE